MSHHHSPAALAKGFADENAIHTTQLTQSRENGGAISIRTVHAGKASPFAASWSHFVAGGYVLRDGDPLYKREGARCILSCFRLTRLLFSPETA